METATVCAAAAVPTTTLAAGGDKDALAELSRGAASIVHADARALAVTAAAGTPEAFAGYRRGDAITGLRGDAMAASRAVAVCSLADSNAWSRPRLRELRERNENTSTNSQLHKTRKRTAMSRKRSKA